MTITNDISRYVMVVLATTHQSNYECIPNSDHHHLCPVSCCVRYQRHPSTLVVHQLIDIDWSSAAAAIEQIGGLGSNVEKLH